MIQHNLKFHVTDNLSIYLSTYPVLPAGTVINTREKAIVDSRDFPSTATENTQHKLGKIMAIYFKFITTEKKKKKISPSLKIPLTVNDSSVFCKDKTKQNLRKWSATEGRS